MIEVEPARGTALARALRLLEEFLRGGDPAPAEFVSRLHKAVETGGLEVLAARERKDVVGAATVAYRPNVALGGLFASVEDLYVRPDARRRGVGRALLEAVGERCVTRGISYVEVQVESEEAAGFYATFGYREEPGVRVFSRSYVQ